MCSITGQVSTRLALGVCFALFASGCGGGRSPVPTAPSNPVISGPPAPPVPPGLTGPYSVTSVVADENGRPIEGASVDACCISGSTYSHVVGVYPLTDSSGRFRMTGIPAGDAPVVQGPQGRLRPAVCGCAREGSRRRRDRSRARLKGEPDGNRAVSTRLSVRVRDGRGNHHNRQTTGGGGNRRLFGVRDFEPAWIYSDQAGRFALCGLPSGEAVRLEAFTSSGAGAYADVPPGQTSDVELVLR